MKTLFYISVAVILAILAYFFLRSIPLDVDSEVTSYPILCNQPSTNIEACEDALALNRTTFRIDKKNKQVVSYMPDVSGIPVEMYNNCAIIDLNNWTCQHDDQSGTFGFKDGDYFIYSKSQVVTEYQRRTLYVSSKQWERIKKR